MPCPKTYVWCPDTRQQQCCQIAGHRLKEKDRSCLFCLRMRHPFFLSGTSGSFCKFKFPPPFFFFKIQLKFYFIYLFVPYTLYLLVFMIFMGLVFCTSTENTKNGYQPSKNSSKIMYLSNPSTIGKMRHKVNVFTGSTAGLNSEFSFS